MSMHPIKKVYCRAFQTVFHLAIPLLPYRRPEILTGTDLLPGLFREKGVRRVLLVTDASIRGLGITAHTEELLAREGIQCTVYDRTVANPTTDNVEEARALYLANGCQAIIGFGGGSSIDCAKAVGARLKQLARKNGAEVAAPLLLREDLRHKDAPGLAALEQLLASGRCEAPAAPAQEIRLFAAPSREEEARAAAGAIRRLMAQGVRCGRIAVVCRDLDRYRAAVRYEFRMADIPLWCDEATTPAFSAPAAAVTALLELAKGADYTEQLSALIKTGLTGLTEEQACALENYAYTWSPKAAEWRAAFAKSPRGFGSEKLTEEEQAALKAADEARAFLIGPVEALRSRCRDASAEQISRALWFCLEALGAEQAQQAQVEALRAARGIPAAEEAAREWNVVMGLLDQMARLLGAETVAPAEYAELFGLLLRSSDLGHIPQTLDAVMLASAGKMRLDAPDYVFVLGVAEGEFPAAPGQTGLLTHADRDALMRQQVDLPDCFENRVVREQICFYKAMTAPAKGLWISWPKGAGLTLSAAAQPIADLLQPAPPELSLLDMAATPGSALDCLGGGWPLTGTQRASLTDALQDEGGGLALLARMAGGPPHKLEDLAALGGLLGDQLWISPSQLEAYANCPYGYFLHYVLGLRPRKKARLSADQSGTLMHWVLQMALDPDPGPDNPCRGALPAPFAQLTDSQLAALSAGLVDEYARRYLPEDTARLRYLLSRLKKSMASLLCYLRDEQAQSAFAPAACELKIGPGPGAVPSQVYRLSDGRTVRLVGTVDRADQWVEDDGTRWVRVVDYKTGTKKLDLKEVYCGLDCQMLLYLFSLTRDEKGRFAGAQPAGVLYLLADPNPATAARAAGRPLPAGRPDPGRGKTVRGHGPRQDRAVPALWMGGRQAQPLPETPPGRRGQAGPDRKAPGRPGGRHGGAALRRRHRGRPPHRRAQPLPVVRLRLYLLPRGGQRRAAGQGPGPRPAL